MARTSSLERTAYHEAGHAVAMHFLEVKAGRVTIVPNQKRDNLGECGGGRALTRRHWPEAAGFHDRHQWRMERDVMVFLAGNEAERIFSGRNNYDGAGNDHRNARELLAYYTPELDREIVWKGKKVWTQTEEFKLHVRLLRLKARRLLSMHWKSVECLAQRLIEKKTLSGEAVVEAITRPYRQDS